MSCPSELEWSMYVDGAATLDEAARLDAHLESCGACRTLVAALEHEARALRTALAEEDVGVRIPAFRPECLNAPRPLAAAAVLIALVSCSFVLAELLRGFVVPAPLAWLNPFTQAGVIDLVLDTLWFVATEGRLMLMSMIETAGAAVFVALLVAAALAAARRGGGAAVFTLALAAVAFTTDGEALEVRRSDDGVVSVPAGETIDDTLIAAGQDVEIDGTITGDLIAFGQRVVIRGSVEGQLVTGARTVLIEGNLGGSVLGAAETVTVRNGAVAGNVYGFAREIAIERETEVGGNGILFGSTATVAGTVGKDLYGFAGEIETTGTVRGDLVAHAGAVRVRAPARIEGDLIAHVANESNVTASPDLVGGEIRTEIREEIERRERSTAERTGSFLAGQAVRFGAAFITGLILLWLVPPLARMSLDTAGEAVTSAGVGLVTLIAVPIIAVMTAITLIGLPVAILAVLAWVAALYLAKIVVAHFIGRALLDRAGRPAHVALALVVGLLIVFLLINIPLIGVLLNFALTITGLGMVVIFIWGLFQDRSFVE